MLCSALTEFAPWSLSGVPSILHSQNAGKRARGRCGHGASGSTLSVQWMNWSLKLMLASRAASRARPRYAACTGADCQPPVSTACSSSVPSRLMVRTWNDWRAIGQQRRRCPATPGGTDRPNTSPGFRRSPRPGSYLSPTASRSMPANAARRHVRAFRPAACSTARAGASSISNDSSFVSRNFRQPISVQGLVTPCRSRAQPTPSISILPLASRFGKRFA